MNRRDRRSKLGWLFLATLGSVGGRRGDVPAEAQLAISANDNKLALVNGVSQVVQSPAPDTITIIDLRAPAPRVVAEIPVPTSVVGPPFSVAITPDEGLALVTAAMQIDPADRTKQIPDNKVSVVDLKATPPRVINTLQAGAGAAGREHQPAGHARARRQPVRGHGVRPRHPGQDGDAPQQGDHRARRPRA